MSKAPMIEVYPAQSLREEIARWRTFVTDVSTPQAGERGKPRHGLITRSLARKRYDLDPERSAVAVSFGWWRRHFDDVDFDRGRAVLLREAGSGTVKIRQPPLASNRARHNLSAILNDCVERGIHTVVRRYKDPRLVIMPVRDYEALTGIDVHSVSLEGKWYVPRQGHEKH